MSKVELLNGNVVIDTLGTRDCADVSLTGFLERCPRVLSAIYQHGADYNLCHPDIRPAAVASLEDVGTQCRSGVPPDLQFAIALPTTETTLHFSSVVGSIFLKSNEMYDQK